MNPDYQVSKCKKCGAILSEPKYEPRSPCPVCEEKGRIHDEVLDEEACIYDHMRMKGKHEGKGKPFFDARVGADFYVKEIEWRHLERVIDRDNNLYIEVIKDVKTGKVIKEVREPLTDHQDHGSAKQCR
ncbi:MAG: hypothetical protein JW943_03160 [Deltaproteobacteria bacterium]|nr:hypothetical protein [Deltaproteobacteria bacterium]